MESIRPIYFLATTDPGASLSFYRDVMGLVLLGDEPFALVFRLGDSELRIQKVDKMAPAAYTALGWEVEDIRLTVAIMGRRGVLFERYAHLNQDEQGVWRSPGGAAVAWFKDPCGNLLSLTQAIRGGS